ncbi:hypothetical protein ACMHYB_39855 [Sorangium sp. So ce1128]
MNAKGILLPILAVAIYMLAACNWTVGDCYPREEWVKGEGAGGPVGPPVPVYTSVASGDFGAEPPEGGERKIQCNKTEDEDEEETPSDSSDRPTASPNAGQLRRPLATSARASARNYWATPVREALN